MRGSRRRFRATGGSPPAPRVAGTPIRSPLRWLGCRWRGSRGRRSQRTSIPRLFDPNTWSDSSTFLWFLSGLGHLTFFDPNTWGEMRLWESDRFLVLFLWFGAPDGKEQGQCMGRLVFWESDGDRDPKCRMFGSSTQHIFPVGLDTLTQTPGYVGFRPNSSLMKKKSTRKKTIQFPSKRVWSPVGFVVWRGGFLFTLYRYPNHESKPPSKGRMIIKKKHNAEKSNSTKANQQRI